MIERELDIATQDGVMNTWTVRPDDGGPLPVVRQQEAHQS